MMAVTGTSRRSLRRTDSVAIEGIADIGETLLLPVGTTRMDPTATSGRV